MHGAENVKVRGILAILAVLAGASILLAWAVWPPEITSVTNVFVAIVYAGLLLLAWVFPVQLREQSINLSLGIQVPLFLQFGAFTTVVVVVAVWFLSQVITGRTLTVFRIQANVSMFSLMTVIGALGYYLVGGAAPPVLLSMSLWSLFVPVVTFIVLNFVCNYIITLMLALVHSEERMGTWTQSVLWDLTAVTVEFVVAWLFIGVQHYYGPAASLFVAIPFAVFVYIFKLYSNLLIANRQLSIISQITMHLSKELREDELLRVLLEGIPQLVVTTTCYVFMPGENGALAPRAVLGPSKETEEQMKRVRMESGVGVAGTSFARGVPLLQRAPHDLKLAREFPGTPPTHNASVLAMPLRFHGTTLGVLTLTHVTKRAYSRRDSEMLQILANQAAIGLWNARRFAETEEQTFVDQLTGIYNYRYFDSALDEACGKANLQGTLLALLLLDLDHFKKVNDCYGHLAGNEVLKSVAQSLKDQVREGDVVCRYGGEEFTVILPGASLETGMQIAERLRRLIESTPISIPPMGNTTILPIRVTVSVGVATYPDMADSVQNLIRNADRAMYVGSKQQGRNRVAAYKSD